MVDRSKNVEDLWDVDAYWRSGNCPWTFFAFPSALADEHGLPADDDAIRLLGELARRGIQVGIWANAVPENTFYFACPKEDIQCLNEAIAELERNGAIEKGFCGKRSEHLFSLVTPST